MHTGLKYGLILLAILIPIFIVSYLIKRKQAKLFLKIQTSDADVQSKCMIRHNAIHAPGVAQVIDGNLIAYNVLGHKIEVPVKEITVVKESLGLGEMGWIGKRVFKLNSPQTRMFALGIARSEAPIWRKVFNCDKR